MAEQVRSMVVVKIENQEDRILLYPERRPLNYHVIASPEVQVKVGDTIEYEPFGINFGWFIRVVDAKEK